MKSETSNSPVDVQTGNLRAETFFAFASFVFALFLATQINSQIVWNETKSLVNQPGFWPVMAIAGMVAFGAFELAFAVRRFRKAAGDPVVAELLHWLRAFEYAVWFLVYVAAVPKIGYLPSTLLFCAALTFRLGYRTGKHLLAALTVAVSTVVIFKSFLSVKIPGGAVYEMLPDALRNFMIINF